MKDNKIKKFADLSKDIEQNALEVDIESLKSGEFEIESIIDVFHDPKDIKEGITISGVNLNGETKRGDVIYISCFIKKSGTSITSPASQCVLKVRIVEIMNGFSYLNKLIK